MLCFCNVMSGRRYIVLDTNLGLLTAAVVERLGSEGTVIQMYTEEGPVSTYRQAVDALNLPKETIDKILFGLQVNKAYPLLFNESSSPTLESNPNSDQHLEETSDENNEKQLRKAIRRKEALKALQILGDKNMDGLLYLTKGFDPLNILLLTLEFLSDSRPFAVFCPYIQPLTNCYFALRKKAVFLRISETWLRKYQVLPDRTRPEMTMSANSGYLLTGIKVNHSLESESL